MTPPIRRILHLADPEWPGGGPCALRMLAHATRRLTHDRHETIVLGNAAALDLARRCGVDAVGNVALPAGMAPLARRALSRAVVALEERGGPFSIVHAWSSRAALLCDAVASAERVVSCAVAPVEGLHAELLGAALAAQPTTILATTVSVRRELLALGVSASSIPVLPAGVDDAPASRLRRRRLRRRWRVDEGTFVMGLVGDPVEWTDARGAIHLLALLRVAGHNAHLVLHPNANHCAHMVRWASPLGLDRHITLDSATAIPWMVASGLDVALLLGDETTAVDPRELGSVLSLAVGGGRPSRPMAGVLPLLWTGAAGVPAIAEASLAACGVIEEGITGLLVEPRQTEAAARRLLALLEDPQSRQRLGIAARTRIAETNPVSAMTVRLRQVYDCLAQGQPVPVPLDGVESEEENEEVSWRAVGEGRSPVRTRGTNAIDRAV